MTPQELIAQWEDRCVGLRNDESFLSAYLKGNVRDRMEMESRLIRVRELLLDKESLLVAVRALEKFKTGEVSEPIDGTAKQSLQTIIQKHSEV